MPPQVQAREGIILGAELARYLELAPGSEAISSSSPRAEGRA